MPEFEIKEVERLLRTTTYVIEADSREEAERRWYEGDLPEGEQDEDVIECYLDDITEVTDA